MKITVLIENTSLSQSLKAEHGLSLFVETGKHKIICDCGQTDAFIPNAAFLGADIENADTVILSHSHFDHSGGIMPLTEINGKARIFIPPYTDADYYDTEGKYIGIDKRINDLPNVTVTEGFTEIDDEITVFGNVTGRKLFPQGNSRLLKKCGDRLVPDDFAHEQYTVIKSGGRSVLISGCAHNGVINILEKYESLFGTMPDAVVSGFHLMKHSEYEEGEIEFIRETARALMSFNTVYYTGHCTGEAMPYLSEIMGDRLIPVSSGSVFTV